MMFNLFTRSMLLSPEGEGGGSNEGTGASEKLLNADGSVNLEQLTKTLAPTISSVVNSAITNHMKRQKPNENAVTKEDIAKMITDKIGGTGETGDKSGEGGSSGDGSKGEDFSPAANARITKLEEMLQKSMAANEKTDKQVEDERNLRLSIERKSAINAALSKFNLHDPDAAATLMDSHITRADDGSLVAVTKDKFDQDVNVPVEDFAEKFIGDSPFLIKNQPAGSGATGSSFTGATGKRITKEDLLKMDDKDFEAFTSKTYGTSRMKTGDPFGGELTAEEITP